MEGLKQLIIWSTATGAISGVIIVYRANAKSASDVDPLDCLILILFLFSTGVAVAAFVVALILKVFE